ncbi:MAG TPA: tetratricopeptide repeat protein, partial [Candidatus Binataceae bacterium]|nr:tetratricopeptide repeat protein [Candidatus Binataceae bacterium]
AAAGATGSPAGGPPPMVAEHTGCPPPPAPTWPQDLDAEIAAAESSGDPGVRQYRALLQDMKDGKYPLVLVQFNKLQRSNPKSPLIEPAEYFAANALFEMKDFGRAILQFNDLVLRYPKGKYASQSLLRQAQAFLNNGNDQLDAKLTLDTLVNKHADAPEVPAAKAMLNCIAS